MIRALLEPFASVAAARRPFGALGGVSPWCSSSNSKRRSNSSVELLGAQQPRVGPQTHNPGDEAPRVGVAGQEDRLTALLGPLALRAYLAVAPEVTFDLPGDPLGDLNFGDGALLAELPISAVGVSARIEVGWATEVVLGLGRVGDLAADPRESEDAYVLPLVRVAEQVELAALEEQVVGVHAACPDLVALHRVVLEQDRLVAKDRRLDLRKARRELMPAG